MQVAANKWRNQVQIDVTDCQAPARADVDSVTAGSGVPLFSLAALTAWRLAKLKAYSNSANT